MKMIVWFCRLVVGSLFIVSGLVKANDPLGFSYKLQEYFSPEVFDLPALDSWAFFFAVLLVVGEVALGVALLIGGKMRLVLWILFLLTLFFAFLTGYAWIEDVVKDCGCFGDALKGSIGRSLTPKESFLKDIILLVLVVVIMIYEFFVARIQLNSDKEDKVVIPVAIVLVALLGYGLFGWPFTIWFTVGNFVAYIALKRIVRNKEVKEWSIAAAVLLLAVGFTFYNYRHLPIKDYRPYKVGANIAEGLKSCTDLGLPCPEYANVYIMTNKNSGETKEINSKEYVSSGIWEDENWEITETLPEPIKLQDGYESPIHDFVFADEDGVDVTAEMLADPNYRVLFISYDLSQLGEFPMRDADGYQETIFVPNSASKEALAKVKAFAEAANAKEIQCNGATSSTYEEIEAVRHFANLPFKYYTGDGTMLKTIVRASPGIVLLKEGIVIGKWHHNDLPTFAEVEAELMK